MTESNPNQILSREERWQQGKALLDKVPWESHSHWKPAKKRPDPVELILERDKGRLKHLLPIKYGRMAASAFAFLRGSAALMAADLATTPSSGIETMLSGDAHLANFGIFATPERQLVFDIKDFDECYPGPWEWDLKRLAVSAVVAGRENGFSDIDNRRIAELVAQNYRETMEEFSHMSTLDVWYYHVDEIKLLNVFSTSSKRSMKVASKAVKKARTRTQEQTLEKLTEIVNGKRQFISSPPLLVRLRDVLATDILADEEKMTGSQVKNLQKTWFDYLKSLPEDRRVLAIPLPYCGWRFKSCWCWECWNSLHRHATERWWR